MTTKPSFFDIPYALPSPLLTAGVTVIATTASDYVGIAISASAAAVTALVYNNSSTASGAILDTVSIVATTSFRTPYTFIVRARNGITLNLSGAGANATIFYTPKG
jgi:hypothetical protein